MPIVAILIPEVHIKSLRSPFLINRPPQLTEFESQILHDPFISPQNIEHTPDTENTYRQGTAQINIDPGQDP